MFSICTNYLKIGEDLFQIKRSFKEDQVKDIEFLKYYLGADSVFRKEGILYFCLKIEEAEIINE